jgi:RNA polymerase primary sigma factor
MENSFAALKKLASRKGFLTLGDILDHADERNLNLVEMERLSGRLHDERLLVLDEEPKILDPGTKLDQVTNRSQFDYGALFRRVCTDVPQLGHYIKLVRSIPPPRSGEEKQLIRQAQNGNPYAYERLIQMFLKVVLRIAYTYVERYGFPVEETIQDGNEGLIIAIAKYDDKPYHRFSAYAPWWITQNIVRKAQGLWADLYIPAYVKDDLMKITRCIGARALIEEKGDYLDFISIEELHEQTAIPQSRFKKIQYLLMEPQSVGLLNNVSKEGLHERIVENSILNHLFLKRLANKLLPQFSGRDQMIFTMRFGLNGSLPMTLQEIGDELGLTRERVRQVIAKSIRFIRSSSEVRQIYPRRFAPESHLS